MAREPRGLAGLTRLGLSPAALTAAIEAEVGPDSRPTGAEMARAVAGAIDANNAEVLRQLVDMLHLFELAIDRPTG